MESLEIHRPSPTGPEKEPTMIAPARLLPRPTPFVLLVVVGLAAGCTAYKRAPDLPGGLDQEISVHVQNLEFNDATVYIFRHSSRYRLGIVPGKGEKTFKTEWTLPDIQLEVSFLAGGGFVTDRIHVGPGDELELIIQSGSQRYGVRR